MSGPPQSPLNDINDKRNSEPNDGGDGGRGLGITKMADVLLGNMIDCKVHYRHARVVALQEYLAVLYIS